MTPGCRRRSDRAGLVGARAAQGPFTTLLAERHARHLAGRAQTLQDARKPMHTDPSTIWVIPYQRTTQERTVAQTYAPTTARLREFAYDDTALPIEEGQTISQPYIVAFMIEALVLRGGEKAPPTFAALVEAAKQNRSGHRDANVPPVDDSLHSR